MHAHTCMHTLARTRSHMHMHAHAHTLALALTHAHTHTHTHIRTRITRYIPLSQGDLERGESVYCQDGNLVASVWRDRKLVYTMSTNCPATGSTQVRRKEKDGSSRMVSRPPHVVEYNKYMARVDKADQLRGYYRVRSKSRKFYKYLFWFLFDCCIVNSY